MYVGKEDESERVRELSVDHGSIYCIHMLLTDNCIYTHARAHTHVQMHICTYTLTYMHTYVHEYIHAHIHASNMFHLQHTYLFGDIRVPKRHQT